MLSAPPSCSEMQSPYVSSVSVNVLCPSRFNTCMKCARRKLEDGERMPEVV